MFSHLRAHPRLVISGLIGVGVAWVVPGIASGITRGLLGWDVGVWIYLVSVGWMMFRCGPERLQQVAMAQSEGAFAVLMLVTLAAVVSFGAVVFEVTAAKASGKGHAAPHLLLGMVTVVSSWLLLPTLFALNYASRYHSSNADGGAPGDGLKFPGADETFLPDYADFLYFAFTIAVASQTADVSISTRHLRRLALLQAVLSFAFNTTVLAFSINIAASLF